LSEDLPGNRKDQDRTFEDIISLVGYLRSPEGCSWDRAQDDRSLRPFLLEETYELIEAIESGDPVKKSEELGDILLHCAFQISLAEHRGEFRRHDVFRSLSEKMKRRHPHLFPGEHPGGDRQDWETLKHDERSGNGMAGILDGLPADLPPLLKAFRLQERVSALNFDWREPAGAVEKVREELGEVEERAARKDDPELEVELGDLLFAVINVIRLLGFHPDNCLRRALAKFAARFDTLMDRARHQGIDVSHSSLEELDAIWERIKEEEEQENTNQEA
jgi:tetrapyrrole methylase family protein/MazG family protein